MKAECTKNIRAGVPHSENPGFFVVIVFAILGLELRAYTLSHITSLFFVMGVFEIGSLELFAPADFEL
jgi:hypothetical protein